MFNQINLRDAANGRLIGTITRPIKGHPLGLLTFSPDSKMLVVKDHPPNFSWDSRNPMVDWSVELWDLPDGRLICGISSLAIVLGAAPVVLLGAWLDRRRTVSRAATEERREE